MNNFGLAEKLFKYQIRYPDESLKAKSFLAFLQQNKSSSFSRSNQRGHFTASAWLLSPDLKQVLLTHHLKLNIWVQLGGHIDNGENPIFAAFREAQEESGIFDIEILSQEIFDIDQHEIPAQKTVPSHYHFDIRYLMRTQRIKFQTSKESKALSWFPLNETSIPSHEESVLRMLRKSRRILNESPDLPFNAPVPINAMRAQQLI